MDYIDPSYHTWITGRFCRNLDGYLMTAPAVREVFAHGSQGADISVIEGVRGLFEGFDGDLGSTAQIAKMLDCPVIFVVDARSITRSAAALVKGYMDFDPQVRIRGVILNKIGGERHAEKARREIERYAKVPVVGVIPRDDDMHLAMRHLGLVPVLEGSRRHDGFVERIERVRRIVEEGLEIDRILEIADEAEMLAQPQPDIYRRSNAGEGLRIGVAVDEAFNFYYRENIELFELAGAEVVPFSPVHDSAIPQVDGIYIGGGYPELYAAELSRNTGMMKSIADAHSTEMPVYAECGGLMYMARELEWPAEESGRMSVKGAVDDRDVGVDGKDCFEMIGLVPGRARKGTRRIVSYVKGVFARDCAIGGPGDQFLGHEFHHSEMVMDPGSAVSYAMRLSRGTGIANGLDGVVDANMIASYVHIHAASYRGFPSIFIKTCRDVKNK